MLSGDGIINAATRPGMAQLQPDAVWHRKEPKITSSHLQLV
uniref:Uncharacterized protein n=1 Tax=Arundo donax TaxID=35708 RepID=A0A0A9HHI2_ARUDO